MIDLTQLKVFVTAAEEKNFSRAAKRLHLSQSAVSQNIRSIEKNFGVELFLRRGRNVQLSEAGHSILPMAREVLNSSRLLEDTLHNINGHIGGEITIGCSTTAGKYLLPNLTASFRQKYHDVRVRVNVMARMQVIDRLLNETACMGVVSKKIDHRDLEYQPFFTDKIILIVHPGHPWTQFGRAMPSDLIDQPIILREETSGTREVVFEGLKMHGISPDMLNVVMELGNAEAIAMAVEEGIGISFVSELVAARGLALGRIKQVNFEGLHLQRKIYAAKHINCPLTRAQSLFWNYVQSQRENLEIGIWDSLSQFIHLVDEGE